jgi:uncharacterized membrane protein
MALLDLGNQVIAKPNNSFSFESGLKVLAVLFIVILLVTLSFVRIGAWLILPFAGLELLAFAYAFYIVYLHANDYDRITIDDENVLVEKRNNKQITAMQFKRGWAKVSLREVRLDEGFHTKRGVFIGSHGNEIEFGKDFISDEERPQLARELKQKLKNI